MCDCGGSTCLGCDFWCVESCTDCTASVCNNSYQRERCPSILLSPPLLSVLSAPSLLSSSTLASSPLVLLVSKNGDLRALPRQPLMNFTPVRELLDVCPRGHS